MFVVKGDFIGGKFSKEQCCDDNDNADTLGSTPCVHLQESFTSKVKVRY